MRRRPGDGPVQVADGPERARRRSRSIDPGRSGNDAGMAEWERVDTDQLHRRAQHPLTGLARCDDVHEVLRAVAPHTLPRRFTPDVALLELVTAALDLAVPAEADRLPYRGLDE